MSRERDQIMGHAAENDGIEEYDNPLPDWWVGLFIFTILFAVGYTVEYHFISNRSQEQSYQAQMEQAKELWPNASKMASVSTDPADIEAGAGIYKDNCAACHGPNLEGGIGPNLTDKVWIHDGTPEGVIKTVTEGVAAKGMPAWGPILGPDRISKVASFIVSKGGTLAPGEAPAEAPAEGAGGTADDAAGAASVVHPEGPELAEFTVEEITPESLAAGEEVFKTNCAACHKEDMTGMVGPNLIDEEWLHGGELADIYRTVTYGVPSKGMVPWTPTLGDEKVRQVTGYVYSKSHGDEAADDGGAEAAPQE